MDEKEIKVSVIIPMYNTEKYVGQCLDSVIMQELKGIEIFVIDDGSTDNSVDIVQSYCSKYSNIKLIRQENQGQGIARNVGMQNATGKYIYFLDSDDTIEKNMFSRLYDTAEENKVDVILFSADVMYDEYTNRKVSNDMYIRKEHIKEKVDGKFLYEEQILNNHYTCSVPLQFAKREFLERKKLKFRGQLMEDELYTFKLFMSNPKVFVLDDFFYHRRVHPSSTITSKKTEKHFFGYYNLYLLQTNLIMNKNNQADKALIMSAANTFMNMNNCVFCMDKSNRKKISNYYKRTLQIANKLKCFDDKRIVIITKCSWIYGIYKYIKVRIKNEI